MDSEKKWGCIGYALLALITWGLTQGFKVVCIIIGILIAILIAFIFISNLSTKRLIKKFKHQKDIYPNAYSFFRKELRIFQSENNLTKQDINKFLSFPKVEWEKREKLELERIQREKQVSTEYNMIKANYSDGLTCWQKEHPSANKSIIIFTCKKLLMTKKKLPVRFTGQHFTIDKVLIKDAIRQANISNQDTVLDIGAGKGFLTVHLLKIANNVVAIENDTALVEHLRKLFSDARNVQVVGCDFRNFAVPKFPFKVVSNIPYGITSDIFKILMFESLGNFLGGSIVLQLEPTQKLFSRKFYNPYTVFYHTFFDLKLVYEVGPESFLPPPTVKSALLNIKRKHLFFDFKFKAKYLAFISCLLEKPDLSVKTALKSIFRKSQVRSISEKFGLNLNAQIVCLSPSQWLNCFLEMLEVVPEKFHPS